MYVCELDRPWLETPFLFQGFYIESEEVIEEIGRYCEHVFVDVERNDDTIRLKRQPMHASSDEDAGATTHTDQDTLLLKTELIAARAAHEKAEHAVEDLFRRVRNDEELEISSIRRTLDPMLDSVMRNDDAMSWLARMKRKNDYIYEHSIASSVWAMMFGKHLGLDAESLQVLGMGAMFLDVGKIKIPSELLVKREALSDSEAHIMRKHVELGVAIVAGLDGIDSRVVEMVACHHERHNGTGYPRGLAGTQIPIFARIAGIVDAYDAMTTERPYAEPKSTYDAMRQLNLLAGVEFADEVVEQFVQAIGVFPVGTLVELNTGEVGIVVAQNHVRRLRPKLMLLLDSEKRPIEALPIVDLRNQPDGERSLWIERGLTPGDYGLDPSEYYL